MEKTMVPIIEVQPVQNICLKILRNKFSRNFIAIFMPEAKIVILIYNYIFMNDICLREECGIMYFRWFFCLI